ncbi:membrane metallo-endopeptidase-like 1 [Drosophila eugracilis]|uniref:membrane metallo-endopeptidase-like 1 n=1 Tax=Drosophila eugracilis TaxID=29029 RepID=UPI001BD91656|nr:membrane metallo-endopeptidase-like 1 [Drosophila eugracilis]
MMLIACLLFAASYTVCTAQRAETNPNTRLLNNILGYVVEDASACGNYFQYACGKYAKRHINDPFTEITQMLDHKVNKNFVQLMEELEHRSTSPGLDKSSVEAKALRFYLTCRNAPKTTRSAEHYLRLAPPDETLVWPQFTARGKPWPKDQFQWMRTLAYLHRYGFTNVLVDLLVTPNYQNSSEFLLDLSKPTFGEDSQHLNTFTETVAILQIMGVPSKSVLPLAQKIRRLESAVRVLTEADDDDDSRIMSLHQLQRMTGYDWHSFVELTLGYRISRHFRVQVQNLHYFTVLKRLMDSSDTIVVANYIMTRFVLYLLEDTMDSEEPIDCIKDVRRSMNLASNLLYEQRFLDQATLQNYTQEIQEIFDQLRRQFLMQIDKNRLGLTSKQRRMVATKARNIILNIGNMPTGREHRSFVSQHYEDLVFSSTDFDYSREHLNLLEFRTRRQMAQLNQSTISPDEYFYMPDPISAMSSSPFYLIRRNIIIVPYGLLQEPLFVPESNEVFKYSLLGFVLAHELAHSVDTSGVLLDSFGNVHDTGVEIFSSPRYEAGLNCMNRNKTQYLDERMADIVGLDLAYSAYMQIAKDINGTDFTDVPPQKIFFLNLAQFFCGDGDATNFLEHDGDEQRLQQIIKGFVPFQRTFGCRSSSFQPEQCQLW